MNYVPTFTHVQLDRGCSGKQYNLTLELWWCNDALSILMQYLMYTDFKGIESSKFRYTAIHSDIHDLQRRGYIMDVVVPEWILLDKDRREAFHKRVELLESQLDISIVDSDVLVNSIFRCFNTFTHYGPILRSVLFNVINRLNDDIVLPWRGSESGLECRIWVRDQLRKVLNNFNFTNIDTYLENQYMYEEIARMNIPATSNGLWIYDMRKTEGE